MAFRALAELIALRTGQVMVTSSLARDAKFNAATAVRYLGLLELSFLTRRLPACLKNRSTRLIKSPKCYVTDSELAAHLIGVSDLSLGRDALARGALFETDVAQNLSALLAAHVPDAQLSYWHEQGRDEVDFVIEVGAAASSRSKSRPPAAGPTETCQACILRSDPTCCCRRPGLQRP